VNRRYRRRRPRLYLSGHLGCLGCSVPLWIGLAAIVALVLLA
jgi:hypothetical protein